MATSTPRLTFDQVTEIVKRGGDALGKLRREKAEQKRYNGFMQKVKSEYASVEDFILASVFGCKTEIAENGTLVTAANPQKQRVIKWRKNDFPYALEEGITHFILWSTESLTEPELQRECESFFLTNERDDNESTSTENKNKKKRFVYFVNPPKFRSIQRIWHAHVLTPCE